MVFRLIPTQDGSEDSNVPIFIVTGTSGSGKSTVIPELWRLIPEFAALDMDLIYTAVLDWDAVKNAWLYIAFSNALSNRTTIICGTFTLKDIEKMDLRYHFDFNYIMLYCSDNSMRETWLRDRGTWTDNKSVIITSLRIHY